MASNENFYRTYDMVVGERGKSGFRIGNAGLHNKAALHIAFSVEKNSSSECNTAKVQVWNLSEENRKMLRKKHIVLYLKAGYDGNDNLILAGNITSVVSTKDGGDLMTEIDVVDGKVAVNNTTVALSFKGKTKGKKIVENIASKIGVTVKYSEGVKFKSFANGFSYIGKARTALTKVCNKSNLVWSIQNGVLHVRKKGKPISTYAYVLSPETGLISIPRKVDIDEDSDSSSSESTESEKTTKTGYEVEYFLNGAIGVNDYVKLESKHKKGYFRVNKVSISGDNFSGDWKCTAQLLEVK